MTANNGGAAFPGINAEMTGIDSDGIERWDNESSGGMTLRDYFAAKAMAALIAKAPLRLFTDSNEDDAERNAMEISFSRGAYEYADAMLKERAK